MDGHIDQSRTAKLQPMALAQRWWFIPVHRYQTLQDVSGLTVAASIRKRLWWLLNFTLPNCRNGTGSEMTSLLMFAISAFLLMPTSTNCVMAMWKLLLYPACLLEQMQSEGQLQQGNYRVLNQQPTRRYTMYGIDAAIS